MQLPSRGGAPRLWTAILLVAIILFLGMWTRIPAPTYGLLPLSVGAPEVTPWLLVVAMFALLLAFASRVGRLRQLAILLSIAAAALPGTVLVQIPSALRGFDAEMMRALGSNYRLGRRSISVPALFIGLRAPAVRSTTGVVFGSPDGQRLTVDIHRPATDELVPVIVQIYGGAWQAGDPSRDGMSARLLAARGYAVFAIDYRHAPRWRWPAQLDDVVSAVAWIREHAVDYGADVSRMALLGRSAGSQLAMLAARAPGVPPIRAVIGYYGPVDLTEGYRKPPRPDPLDIRSVNEALLGGTPDDMPERYREASPITFADEPHPPTLIIDGGRDHIVEPHFGRALHDRLRRSGTSVLLIIPWADHAFDAVPWGPSGQISLYYTERFLAWAMRASPAK